MNSLKGIAIVPSGEKYTTRHGFTAIRDGIKLQPYQETGLAASKPEWLRARTPAGSGYDAMRELVEGNGLATVCKEARCPNIGECWNAGTATLMLMGEVCTRACRFCAVDTGNPQGWLDRDEPAKVARTVATLKLNYVVLTSVNRDDLPDGGAAHFAACIGSIKHLRPAAAVEALTPDFNGERAHLDLLLAADLQVFAQNIETVRRLTHPVRDPRAGYEQTLSVLRHAKSARPDILVKTSLMAGLGETDEEILAAMDDLRAAGVDILTIGQYLQPTKRHLPVRRWVEPEQFLSYREAALQRGFVECVAGPLVRSSYRAERVLQRNNAGLA
jgi:lipoic acid synthetase